ncbi:hypothetical protein [Sphingobacterium athyrii]|uniref:Uncharacterized protein n=1 Tax=Sphingobacterium athyrii TaxID=2152717 RepID=A0A363NPR8_9SPHI|nr:hypothetical protein [Sphingobacterium athyrii]PUV22661.1 hypothetical protein DCO56_20915 [Sphingobacterium athyrii]
MWSEIIITLFICIVLNFYVLKWLKDRRKMRPKGILAYLITPILYLCIRLLMIKWVFLTVFALAWIAIIIFLLRKTIIYFTPQKFRSEKEEIIDTEIVDPKIDENSVVSLNPKDAEQPAALSNFQTTSSQSINKTDQDQGSRQPNLVAPSNISAVEMTEIPDERHKKDRKLLLLQRISFYATIYNLIYCLFLLIRKAYLQTDHDDNIIGLFGTFQINSIVCLVITAIICKLFDTLNKLTNLIQLEKKGYRLFLFIILGTVSFFYFRKDFIGLESLIMQSYTNQGIFFLIGTVTFLLSQLAFMTIDYPSFIQYQFSRKRDLRVIIILNLFLLVLVMIICEVLLNGHENSFDSSHLFTLYPTVLLFFLERKNYIQAKNYVNRVDL